MTRQDMRTCVKCHQMQDHVEVSIRGGILTPMEYVKSLCMEDVAETEIGEKKVYFKMKESQYISMRDPKKSLGKNSIVQYSMFHLDLGIQIKQGH